VPCEPTSARFEAILAPDDSWMIFDLITGIPAEIDGHALIGLDRQAASALERGLNLGKARLIASWKSRCSSDDGGRAHEGRRHKT
jgi:hypothetical protein